MTAVATRPRRFLAIWFVAMLVMAALPGLLPTAQAGHGITIETFTVTVTKHGNPLTHIVNGSSLAFSVMGRINTQCTSTVLPAEDPDLDLSITSTQLTGTFTQTTEQRNGNRFWLNVTGTATRAGPTVDVANFAATVNAVCPTSHHATSATTTATSNVAMPARIGTVDATYQLAIDRSGVDVPAPSPTHSGIGTTVRGWVNITAPSYFSNANLTNVLPANVSVDLRTLGMGTLDYLSPKGNIEFVVTLNQSATLDGTITIPVAVRDTGENYRNLTLTHAVDTVRPATALANPLARMVRTGNSTDITVQPSWTATSDVVGVQVAVGGTVIGNITTTATPLTTTSSTNVVSLRPFDKGGNLNSATYVDRTLPTIAPTKYTSNAAAPTLVPGAGVGPVTFTIGNGPTAADNHQVTVTLERLGVGFWNGGAPEAAGSYQTANIPHFRPAAGATGATVTLANFTGVAFPDGNYRFNFTANGTEGTTHYHSYFKIDSQAPTLSAPSLLANTTAVHTADNNTVNVIVFLNETRSADSGIRNVTVELTNVGQTAVVANVHGNLARLDLTNVGCDTATPPTSCLTFPSSISASFPNLSIGNYVVRVIATDVAGNTVSKVFSADSERFQVRPRVALLNDTAWLTPEGIRAYALAAHVLPAGSAGSFTCESGTRLCTVTNVTYEARNIGAAPVTLGTVLAPLPGAAGRTAYKGFEYYNYTPGAFATTGLNTSAALQVRATANVRIGDVTYTSDTGWLEVHNPDAPTIGIQTPSFGSSPSEWAFNTTGTIGLNATFNTSRDIAPPVLTYTLVSPTVKIGPVPMNAMGTGHKFVFNYTANITQSGGVPPGEYVLFVNATDANNVVTATRTRFVAVVMQAPVVQFPTAADTQRGSGIAVVDGQFQVDRTFDIAVTINHGDANITSDAAFSFELQRVLVNAGQNAIIQNGQEGFTAVVKNASEYDPARKVTHLNVTVTLPTEAGDKSRYILNVTAETDARLSPGTAYSKYTGTGFTQVQLDLAPPTAVVADLESNLTGRDITAELIFRGYAEESGSGVKRVEARLYDMSRNMTFVWNAGALGGGWIGGKRDDWMSSDVLRPATSSTAHVKNVIITPPPAGSSIYRWDIYSKTRPVLDADGNQVGSQVFQPIKLDRATLYELEVRVTDNLGRTSSETRTILFDPDPPVLMNKTSLDAKGGLYFVGGKTAIDWHSTSSTGVVSYDVLTTNVSENHCLRGVYLKGRAPSGAIVTAPFDPPTANRCKEAEGIAEPVTQWTVNLTNHKHMTNEIGTYYYWVEAEDISGKTDKVNPANGNNMSVVVRDTKQAVVSAAQFEPSIAQAGGSSRLYAHIEENAGISRIDVTLIRLTQSNSRGANLGTAQMVRDEGRGVAANGTGWYVLDIASAFNVSLETGNYLVEIRARDLEGVNCVPVCYAYERVLAVVADAAPDVLRESPATGVAYVNATPELTYRVVDPQIVQSKVKVSAGSSATSLTELNATLTALGSGGNTTGFLVKFRVNAVGFENLTVQVSATDESGFTTTVTDTFAVDAAPPTVNATVTGTVLGADNRTYAVEGTRITLEASDELSGLAQVGYAIGTGTPQLYSAPFSPLTASTPDGLLRVTYAARDNASNVANGTLEFQVDRTGPVVTVSNDGSTGQDVVISVRDDGVGVNESSLYLRYAYGEAQTFSNATFEKVSGNLFKVTLPGNASTAGLRYYIESRDLLGNAGPKFSAASPFVISPEGETPANLAPTIEITEPLPNLVANGTLALRWTATDPDGDELTITIALREPVGAGRVLVSAGENSGLYTLDVSGFAAGTYTLVVTASDESETAQDEVTFRIAGNTTTPTNPVRLVQAPAANSTAGRELTFAVQLDTGGRTLRSATFTVVRDGQQVGNGTLIPLAAGLRGTYTPTAPGSYAILVSATFADGTSMPATQATTFTVQNAEEPPAAGGFPASLVMLLAVGVLTIALAAYGAFGRWRK